MKKFLYIIFVFYLFINIENLKALVISEVMYDPIGLDAGREWVEIYNEESNAVTVSNYKLNEYNSNADPNTNDNHTITATETLASHEYGIISNGVIEFKKDYPNYTGKLYKASFILSNSKGQKISIRYKPNGASDYNILSEIDTTNYLSIASGHTICNNKVEQNAEEWGDCNATPGMSNTYLNAVGGGAGSTGSSTATSTAGGNNSTSTATSTVSVSAVTVSVPVGINYFVPNTNLYIKVGDMNIDSIKEKNVMAGSEFNLVVRTFNNKNEAIKNLKYYWSTGDGGYYEGDTLKYKYHLPGTYDYTIEAGDDSSYAIYRGVVNVHEPLIRITNAATNSNYIIIKNDMNVEIDIGGYIIKDNVNNKSYKIARNTMLKADRDLKLIGAAMGFVSTSSDSFSLLDMGGNSLSEYKRPIAVVATTTYKSFVATTTIKSYIATTSNKFNNVNNLLSYEVATETNITFTNIKNFFEVKKRERIFSLASTKVDSKVEYKHNIIHKL